MKKRANNDGNIRQRSDGRWEARYTAGYDVDGKQVRKSLYDETKEGVSKQLRETLRLLERGELVEPSSISVAEWLDTWFKVYGRPRWRESTASEHYRNIENNLKPKLGKHRLQKLRHEHIQAYINDQAVLGRATMSIRKQLEPLRAALKQAEINGLIVKNPANHLSFPTNTPREIDFLTIPEQHALIAVLPDSTSGRALHFVLSTGLRASELCGLRWMDIEGDHFTIRQSAQRVLNLDRNEDDPKYKLSISAPKTKAGMRSIPLTGRMIALLDLQRSHQRLECIKAGSAWEGDVPGRGRSYVFANELDSVDTSLCKHICPQRYAPDLNSSDKG